MEEELITFETAKLAKDKGFNINVSSCYGLKSKIMYSKMSHGNSDDKENVHVSAPTQALLQKWLRDFHNIHIQIQVLGQFVNGGNKFYSQVIEFGENKWISKFVSTKIKFSYEEALEIGLQEALKLIK